MRKAIGLIGCTTLLAIAALLWLTNGSQSAHTASAQIDALDPMGTGNGGAENYDAIAHRLMGEARMRAQQGDVAGARKLAQRAGTFPVTWTDREQSPRQLLQALSTGTASGDQVVLAQETGQPGPLPVITPANRANNAAAPPQVTPVATPLVPELDPAAVASWTPKQEAARLLLEARIDITAGRHEQARAKALKAKQLNVAYNLFEERPEHILADVERKSATVTIASPIVVPANVAEVAAASSQQAQAQQMLKQAREAVAAGRFDAARQLALEVQQLQLTYSLFEDRPELVLSELDRVTTQTPIANTQRPTASQPATPTPAGPEKQQAASLIEDARLALKQGQLSTARDLANQAASLNVTYDVFDDRPELVLAEINRVLSNSQIADTTQPGATTPEKTSETLNQRDQVAELLKRSRAALVSGDLDAAQQIAQQASQVKMSYRLFDDRPDLVLNDIERARQNQAVVQNPLPIEGPADSAGVAGADQKALAIELLKAARADIAQGQLETARAKALEAQTQKIIYNVFDDRPELVIAEINRLLRNGADSVPLTSGPDQPLPQVEAKPSPTLPEVQVTATPPRPIPEQPDGQPIPRQTPPVTDVETAAVVSPNGPTAVELYNQGLYHLRHNDRQAARDAFLKAYRSGQPLDGFRRQQLQDFLRELTPRNAAINLVGNQTTTSTRIGPDAPPQPGQLDIVEQQRAMQYDRLRTEVLNAVFRAERLKERNSDQALEVLDRVTASVENSELSTEAATTLLRHIQNAQESIRSYQSQRAPLVDLERKNRETMELIRQDRENQIRVEQEFAQLVEQYNKLFKERRYAEAEIVAKQSKELDPDNPVAQTLVWKARFARRIQRDDETRDLKEDSWVRTMQDVDDDVVNQVVGDSIAYPDIKTWKDLTQRRSKYGTDNRIRTETELQIEESLNRQISLHFDNSPLKEVMRHVSTVANINVVLDSLGLEEEGVTTNDPVSIDVDGIRLRSALKLMLEPKKLAFTIEDDVLKITSEIRQQGRMAPVTYPVADLVVPIYNSAVSKGQPDLRIGDSFGNNSGQFSVPTGGMPQVPGQSFFQVDDLGGQRGFGDYGLGNGMTTPRVNGGSTVDFQALMDLIVSTVHPDTWDEVGGGGTMKPFESTLSLVIRQTQQVHQEISDLLAQLRR
ncbi:MAG: hypothetical protein ABGZ17_28290, partial [Planctomycetaceae bacterium]